MVIRESGGLKVLMAIAFYPREAALKLYAILPVRSPREAIAF